MKNLLVLSIALVALVIVGCSDRSNTAGPVSDDQFVAAKAIPQTGDAGVLIVSTTVVSNDLPGKYFAEGNVEYTRSSDGQRVTFNVDTKIVLTNMTDVTGETYLVVGHSAFVLNPKENATDRLPLGDNLAGYDLELVYSIGTDVQLMSIAIVPTHYPTTKPAPQTMNGTVAVDRMVGTDGRAAQYHAVGTISYSLLIGNNFRTETKIVLRSSNGLSHDEVYYVVGTNSSELRGSDQVVVNRFPLNNNLSGFDLQLTYLVGAKVQLMDVAIAPSIEPQPIPFQ